VRLVSYETGQGPRAGLLHEERVLDVWGEAGELRAEDRSLDSVLRGGLLGELRPIAGDPGTPLDELDLLPPLTRPDKIICIGLNYRSHAEEQGAEPPETPTFFAKFRNALVPTGATVALPTAKVDYEAEVAFVIGDVCRDVPEDQALSHVAGYTLVNDLSARDRQFATPQWMPGKVFDGAAPCGPALVTPDEAGPPDAIEIELRLNGELRQQASTADLVHSIPRLVSHLSSLMTLVPGDLVATGSPAGVGSMRNPRSYLQPGDVVEISSPQLGTLVTELA
jgi:2-keto-4-pentenoate hydratase/2-oxohepta-3-ene-1,7-dioic acid hydratase in catechol pathway